jgi:hypothetical protein
MRADDVAGSGPAMRSMAAAAALLRSGSDDLCSPSLWRLASASLLASLARRSAIMSRGVRIEGADRPLDWVLSPMRSAMDSPSSSKTGVKGYGVRIASSTA